MRTITLPVYRLSELSEEAQERAYNDWLRHAYYPWAQENRESLEAFASLFGVRIEHFEYGSYGSPYINYRLDHEERDLFRLSGVRLWKYLVNNDLIPEETCPFTGYYLDEVLLEPFRRFLERPTPRTTLQDLIEEALHEWVHACDSDAEHYYSFENFQEVCDMNEWEFFEDGAFFG